jgi:phosphatidylglycerophosphate synthase
VATVRRELAIGLAAQLVLLAVLARSVGLAGPAWLAGTATAAGMTVLLGVASSRAKLIGLGAANRVTLLRATLVGGIAALAAELLAGAPHPAAVVTLAVPALLLDAVDGWVARRTGSASEFGARFDMEVDAFLILVLSCAVVRSVGAWVLLIGAGRYLFLAAGGRWAWLRAPLPARYWRKPVAALQGIVLTAAVAGVLPVRVVEAALVAALVLLAESFGRDVWWLHRNRLSRSPGRPDAEARPGAGAPDDHAGRCADESRRPEWRAWSWISRIRWSPAWRATPGSSRRSCGPWSPAPNPDAGWRRDSVSRSSS